MSYTTQARIESEFKDQTFTSLTAVTDADIAEFILDADAEMNSYLGLKYVTPITGTESLILMRLIATWLIKERVQDIIASKTGNPKTEQSGTKGYRDRALAMLKDISLGKVKLSDAVPASSADGVQSYSGNNSSTVENTFRIGENQW